MGEGDDDALDNDAIVVVEACCCYYNGCLFSDGCFGCMWSETICCCELELCCKSGQDYLCCGCCALRFVSPEVCCKSQGQVCCCAGASGIPCDDEVPCMFGTCGIICYPGLNVCKTLGEIRRGGEGGDANDEPSASD